MSKILTLGEIMLRLATDTGIRLDHTQQFMAHYGGGEANVAISLANYGHEVKYASKVPSNPLGNAVKKHLQSYGVLVDSLIMGGERLGMYYLESGCGERGAAVVYDRAYSSFATMKELEWNFDQLFADVELIHLSGITPALSKNWQKMILELLKEAKKRSIKISFDMNYRGKLWTVLAAKQTFKEILPYVDYCSAGKLDALNFMDIPENESALNLESAADMAYYYQAMNAKYPNIQVFYSTLREVYSASHNTLQGTVWNQGELVTSKIHEINPIVDRVGGGDAFAGGILHGLLVKMKLNEMVDFATAASALKHTIHGDCNQFSIAEVKAFVAAESGKIVR
ncbi:PfkB family carbohydrate kinase [Carnobacterium gallinarum]|uniref:sugar kinase n=1 Tax=Carnobacterium gallinarum TaxID=2749 RepID=UPI0005551CCE|nr:sugar kinase [Carnobacterium gallinarum]